MLKLLAIFSFLVVHILFAESAVLCNGVQCGAEEVCESVVAARGACFIAPCPRLPTCVPKKLSCSTGPACPANKQCILRAVSCDKEPCRPIRLCVAYPKCKENEEYNECSMKAGCATSCSEKYPSCPDSGCGSGACECKQGYTRHNGKCIAIDVCPDPECGANMKWDSCPPSDAKTCRNRLTWKKTGGCNVAHCVCKSGFVRDDDWVCVEEKSCPTKFDCADPNAELKKCRPTCEPTCDNREPSCPTRCGEAKCVCKKGFARHGGNCIMMGACPQWGGK